MDVRLPDGTVIRGVPDDMSRADLVVKLKTNGYDTSKLEAPTAPTESGAGAGRGMVNPPNVEGPRQYTDTGAVDALISLGLAGAGRLAGLGAAGTSTILSGLSGTKDIVFGNKKLGDQIPVDPGRPERWLADTQEFFNRTPVTQSGKDTMKGLGEAANWVGSSAPVQAAGKVIDAVGTASPVTGAAIASLPDLLALFGAKAQLAPVASMVGDVAAKPMNWAANKLMASALKPTVKAHLTGDASAAVDTALKFGISPTEGGLEKLRALIDSTNERISTAIKGSDATVSRDAAMSRVDPVMTRFATQAAPDADVAAVQSVREQFGRRPETLTVQEAQALKQGTYQKLAKAYNGELGTASIDTQKAIARGLKEDIAAAVPEISGLNALDSQLYKTLDVLERRTLMEMNKNPLGLTILSHSPAGWAAMMADKSAAFKSIIARMLNSASKTGLRATEVPKPAPIAPFNPSIAYGVGSAPVAAKAAATSPLGDLTPDFGTTQGFGGGSSGLFPNAPLAIKKTGVPYQERVGPRPEAPSDLTIPTNVLEPDAGVMGRRLRGRPQMPAVSGLLGSGDTIIAGGPKYANWADAMMREAPTETPLQRLGERPTATRSANDLAASPEALARLASEADAGRHRMLLNRDSTTGRLLKEVGSVDHRPQATEMVWQADGKGGFDLLDKGEKVTKADVARAKAKLKQGLMNDLGLPPLPKE